jgi:hypothetical protein
MPAKPKLSARPGKGRRSKALQIEHLSDLEPHSDQIFAALNSDRRRALLAVVEPVQVLADLGYRLSPNAAQELRSGLPRFSRQARSAYVAWLNDQQELPPLPTIHLARRGAGTARMRGKPPSSMSLFSGPIGGANTAGYDILAHFGEDLCARLLKHHYASGRLPQSVYRVAGKPKFYRDAQSYQDALPGLAGVEADRVLHINVPALELSPSRHDRARVISQFVAEGFATVKQGTLSVDGVLAVHKDATGHPEYIELLFENIVEGDMDIVGVAASATELAELKQFALAAYQTFRASTANAFVGEQRIPLTLGLVNGAALKAAGVTAQPGEVIFRVVRPAGAASASLAVGFNRASRAGNGSITQAGFVTTPGDDLIVFQDVGWLEPGLNAAYAKGLPIRLNQDTGESDPNGDLVLSALAWKYRKGGLTGRLTGTLEDALWGFDAGIEDEIRVAITYSIISGTVEGSAEGTTNLVLSCLVKAILAIIGAVIGFVVGGIIGGIIGGIVGGAFGAGVGATVGATFGVFAMPYLLEWWWFPAKFESHGLTPEQVASTKKMSLAHDQPVPESTDSVAVKPRDFAVEEWGTRFVAKVDGPATDLLEPGVTVSGYHVATPAATAVTPSTLLAAPPTQPADTLPTTLAKVGGSAVAGPAGWVILHYRVDRTWGLQGKPSFAWTFNDKPVGSGEQVEFVVPLLADQMRANEVTYLGTLKLAATDLFGRKATWSGTLTIGNQKDLHAFVPQRFKKPGYVDPRERLGVRVRPPENATHVAWSDRIGGVAAAHGELVAQDSLLSPALNATLAIICTAP